MKPRHKRLAIIVSGVIGLTAASLFVLNAFQSNLYFFFPPTETFAGKAPPVIKIFRFRRHGRKRQREEASHPTASRPIL